MTVLLLVKVSKDHQDHRVYRALTVHLLLRVFKDRWANQVYKALLVKQVHKEPAALKVFKV